MFISFVLWCNFSSFDCYRIDIQNDEVLIHSLHFFADIFERRPVQDEVWGPRSLPGPAAAPHRRHGGHERGHHRGRLRQPLDQHLLFRWEVQGEEGPPFIDCKEAIQRSRV